MTALITLLVFLVILILSFSALVLFVEAPSERRKLSARVAAIDDLVHTSGESVLRQEAYSRISAVNRILVNIPMFATLRLFLQQAGVRMTAWSLFSSSALIVMVVALLLVALGLPSWLAIAGSLATGAGPFVVVAILRQRRFNKFDEIFPDAIDTLARAVRAGHAASSALELIATEMPDPVAREFRILYEQQNLGMPMRDALERFAIRMPRPDVRVFVSSMQIQRESGGNLAEVLDNLAHVIRERFKLFRQVRVYTAEGRMSLFILTLIPPVGAVLLYLSNADYMSRLFTDPLGTQMIGMAILLQIVGFLVIKRIVTLKV